MHFPLNSTRTRLSNIRRVERLFVRVREGNRYRRAVCLQLEGVPVSCAAAPHTSLPGHEGLQHGDVLLREVVLTHSVLQGLQVTRHHAHRLHLVFTLTPTRAGQGERMNVRDSNNKNSLLSLHLTFRLTFR